MEPRPINVSITFHEPDKRRRDMDGMLSQSKNMLDGIADAIGVDDHLWSLSLRRGEVRKGGAVVVEIET
jgi:crossover junction endodeoxyribonuclease RusA